MEIISTYRITYTKPNVIQIKNLVSHKRYVELKIAIEKEEIDKNEIKKLFGNEFFTDESPLALAIPTGLLVLPKNQGGTHECEFELIT